MPTQYVTIKHNQPEFADYLWGRKEQGVRAIPIKTYNLGTPEESVTFEMRPYSELQKPNLFKLISSVIKLRSFILILFPLFYVVVKNVIQGSMRDPQALIFSVVAMFLLFAGLNIRNDVYDHISGFDRVNLDSSTKPIRMGWLTAYQASRWSLALIFLSGMVALPLCVIHPELLYDLGCALILFFIGKFSKNNSYKEQHLGELVLFLLVGPALVAGFQISLGAKVDAEILAFGFLWGYAVLYLVQVNNFSHIMTSSQSKIKNSMTKLGFDLSQKFLILGWLGFILGWLLFHIKYGTLVWLTLGTLLLVLGSLPLFIRILNIKSPMGSGLLQVRRLGYKVFLFMVFLFVSENLWYLWTINP